MSILSPSAAMWSARNFWIFASSPVTLGMAITFWRKAIDFSRFSSILSRTLLRTLAVIRNPSNWPSLGKRRLHVSQFSSAMHRSSRQARCGRNRLENAMGRERQVVHFGAETGKRVVDGTDDCGWRPHGAALSDACDSELGMRRRSLHVEHPDVGDFNRAGEKIVQQARGKRLSPRVERHCFKEAS